MIRSAIVSEEDVDKIAARARVRPRGNDDGIDESISRHLSPRLSELKFTAARPSNNATVRASINRVNEVTWITSRLAARFDPIERVRYFTTLVKMSVTTCVSIELLYDDYYSRLSQNFKI